MCLQETILADAAALVSRGYSERYVAKLISGNTTFLDRLREGRVTIAKAQEAGRTLKVILAKRQAEAKMQAAGESPASA